MKLSVGNDLIETSRVLETYQKFGDKFLEKIFSQDERNYCLIHKNPAPYLAARFACKEAFIKALDLKKGQTVDFREIELAGTEFGKKNLKLTGKALALFEHSGYSRFTVSVTHTENYASAVVILYGE
ncbi:MAG: holo-ACP synthase [Leptospiraceae bacterium]|nr:holo-ACP synthase [Leptospiraceae bacterium]